MINKPIIEKRAVLLNQSDEIVNLGHIIKIVELEHTIQVFIKPNEFYILSKK